MEDGNNISFKISRSDDFETLDYPAPFLQSPFAAAAALPPPMTAMPIPFPMMRIGRAQRPRFHWPMILKTASTSSPAMALPPLAPMALTVKGSHERKRQGRFFRSCRGTAHFPPTCGQTICLPAGTWSDSRSRDKGEDKTKGKTKNV
jgi:hypothetical protein